MINLAQEGAASHHEEHPDHRLFGVLVFLCAESMLFMGLFIAYITFRLVAVEWPPAGTPELEILLPGINSLILISSSFVIHKADTAVKNNDVAGVRTWFSATVVMGTVFLLGQLYEYSNLEFGLTRQSVCKHFLCADGLSRLACVCGLVADGGGFVAGTSARPLF